MSKFTVWETTNGYNELVSYSVKKTHSCPSAIEFPVSAAHDEDTQYRRAKDYCKYLNKLEEAAEIAYQQNQLVDILGRP